MAGKHSKSFNSVQPPVKVPSYVVWDQTTVEPVASVDPKREIAACASCHGPGGYLIGAPALINQNALYLEQQLTAFAQGTRTNDTNMPMRTIAGLLTPAEMKSLAFAYSKGLEGSR